jgi:hypothetical protein
VCLWVEQLSPRPIIIAELYTNPTTIIPQKSWFVQY